MIIVIRSRCSLTISLTAKKGNPKQAIVGDFEDPNDGAQGRKPEDDPHGDRHHDEYNEDPRTKGQEPEYAVKIL